MPQNHASRRLALGLALGLTLRARFAHPTPHPIPRTTGDVRYLVSAQQWKDIYAWQWLYLPLLYGFLAILTRIQDVMATFVDRTSGPIRVNFYGGFWQRVVAPKVFWATYRVAIPLFVWGVPASTFFPLFLLSEVFTGFYLAYNFEVSHVSNEVEWPLGGALSEGLASAANKVLPRPWADSQVATGVDYAHDSWAHAWWSGALNYQIEHHLFPGISQYHYPAIAHIVKKAAEDFGIPYRLEPTFWAAWTSHVKYLALKGASGIAHKMD